MIKILALSLLIMAMLAQGTAEEDRVTWKIEGYGDYPWYSGYLQVSKSTAFHYVFFTSQHDPANDPLVLWLNGGPGCSSLIGMVYEHGPFIFKVNSTDYFLNQFSWNKKANVLYLESPGQVGFSLGNKNHTDQSVTTDNLEALRSFFSKFPQFRANAFYISGESYGGIYVPYLAFEIHNYNKNPTTALPINLKGIIVGNACTDPRECYTVGKTGTSLFQYQFLYKRTFYTSEQYDLMRSACVLGYDSDNCKMIRDTLDKKFVDAKTSILNIYSKCYGSTTSPKLKRGISPIIRGDLDCDDQKGALNFFNDKAIRNFLHVGMGNDFTWSPCNDDVYNLYVMDQHASYWIYHLLMRAGYRIWVFSGDIDADVPITGTINWLTNLRFDFNVPIVQPWRQWWSKGKHPYEDQVGGMVWQLQNLTFVSVKNAGHMVPRDQPELAYNMFQTFLDGGVLPQKDDSL